MTDELLLLVVLLLFVWALNRFQPRPTMHAVERL